ncbi:MAG: Uncharacterised protein [Owenweeksia sp. TMED14]|nr:MAG: Uncharacterised protein [Owenweeksia sp. TMED14]
MQSYQYDFDCDTIKKINIRALGYFRNTEFFHPMEKGRTLLGTQLIGFWKSDLKSQQHLEVGAVFHQVFGGPNRIFPHITLVKFIGHYSLDRQIRFGSLSNPGHNLPEPFYNPGNRYLNPTEYGFQYISTETDIWMNWDQSISYGSPFKESFVAGINHWLISHKLHLLPHKMRKENKNTFFDFRAKIYGMYRHIGGQIDIDESGIVGNRINAGFQVSVNPEISMRIGQKRILLKVPEYKYSFMQYHDPMKKFFDINMGSGHLHSFSKTWNKLGVYVKLWRGKDWLAPFAQGIYQSYNPEDIAVSYQEMSRFFILSSNWAGSLFGSNNYSVGYDAYYDRGLKRWNTAFTFNFLVKM